MSESFEELLRQYGARERTYKRGDIIYSNENGVEGIYFLLEGKVRIDNSAVKGKREVLVWLLGSGSFFGISSYYNGYDHSSYISSVVSKDACVLIISREEFIHLLKLNVAFRDFIIKLLYRRMDYIEARKRYSVRSSFKKRMVDTLLFLSPSHTPPNSAYEGNPYKIFISLAELSQMLNASRKQLLKNLEELISKNILERENDGIIIKNINRLITSAK